VFLESLGQASLSLRWKWRAGGDSRTRARCHGVTKPEHEGDAAPPSLHAALLGVAALSPVLEDGPAQARSFRSQQQDPAHPKVIPGPDSVPGRQLGSCHLHLWRLMPRATHGAAREVGAMLQTRSERQSSDAFFSAGCPGTFCPAGQALCPPFSGF